MEQADSQRRAGNRSGTDRIGEQNQQPDDEQVRPPVRMVHAKAGENGHGAQRDGLGTRLHPVVHIRHTHQAQRPEA
jgi:hypothetical protein